MIFALRRASQLRDCGYLPQRSLLAVSVGDGFNEEDLIWKKAATIVEGRNRCMNMLSYLPDDRTTQNETEDWLL